MYYHLYYHKVSKEWGLASPPTSNGGVERVAVIASWCDSLVGPTASLTGLPCVLSPAVCCHLCLNLSWYYMGHDQPHPNAHKHSYILNSNSRGNRGQRRQLSLKPLPVVWLQAPLLSSAAQPKLQHESMELSSIRPWTPYQLELRSVRFVVLDLWLLGWVLRCLQDLRCLPVFWPKSVQSIV